MLRIPPLKLALWHPDELVRDGAVFLVNNTLLTDGVSLPTRNQINPENIVYATEEDAGLTLARAVRVDFGLLTFQYPSRSRLRTRSSQSLLWHRPLVEPTA